MISMELSSVQHNTQKSADLAAAKEIFLANGGTIYTLEGFVQKPKPPAVPYGRKSPPAPKPTPAAATTLKRRAAVPRIKIAQLLKDRVSALAPDMTKQEIVRATGLSEYMLNRLAKECGIEYKKHDPTPFLKPPQIDPIADAMNVIRVKTARDQGLARKQAAASLGISRTLIDRLVEDYGIEYPKRPPGKRR